MEEVAVVGSREFVHEIPENVSASDGEAEKNDENKHAQIENSVSGRDCGLQQRVERREVPPASQRRISAFSTLLPPKCRNRNMGNREVENHHLYNFLEIIIYILSFDGRRTISEPSKTQCCTKYANCSLGLTAVLG